jgi:hypothetical protein
MSAKQVTQIRMGAYIYNGAALDPNSFRAFTTFPQTYNVWNINYQYNADFLGGAVQDTLSGYQRGNPMGHRLNVNISLNNSLPTDTEAIRNLLNRCASRYDRVFFNFPSGISSVGATTFTLPGSAPAVANYFKALTIKNVTLNQEALILTYGSNRQGTMTTTSSWQTNHAFQIIAKPSHPTIIGVSFDNSDANIKYFNLASESFGLNRELTVGNSIIQMSLTGVFSDAVMDSNIVMQ